MYSGKGIIILKCGLQWYIFFFGVSISSSAYICSTTWDIKILVPESSELFPRIENLTLIYLNFVKLFYIITKN